MSSPRQDLNLRQMVYKTIALPLSYKGKWVTSARHPQETLPAIFTALEGSEKKHWTLFFLFSGTHQMGWETLEFYLRSLSSIFNETGEAIPLT